MGVRNVVLMFILVWTFTAADDYVSVSCEDVTGTVRKEVTFTCSVSLKRPECCITFYKFQYPEKYNDPAICRDEFPQDCEQRNSFTCNFSPTTEMMGEFRYFVQTSCGSKITEFTVNITEPKSTLVEKERREGENTRSGIDTKSTVIAAVTGCLIIIIFIIIIIMTIIYIKKPNYSQSCGFQRMFLCHKHDDNNSNFQEQNPENLISLTAV